MSLTLLFEITQSAQFKALVSEVPCQSETISGNHYFN